MDWLQGPMNPSSYSCFFEGFEEQITRFNGDHEEEGKMPFLHMLQSFETPSSFSPLKEPGFQALLRLQHLKKTEDDEAWEFNGSSCGAVAVDASPVKFEAEERDEMEKTTVAAREKRKRKRTRPSKNKEEVESQRMTHIAVERDRRRQMNDHLNVLRSLMPKTHVQRGDQASIVGGAIDFVKELEQLVWSLEAQKRIRSSSLSSTSSSSSSSSSSLSSMHSVLTPIYEHESYSGAVRAEKKTEAANVEATVIQTHVNLKVECPKTHGQLLRAIVALEELGLTVLHLNIASSLDTALYSFNLKIEDGCELRSADEISKAVHRMFDTIDGINGS